MAKKKLKLSNPNAIGLFEFNDVKEPNVRRQFLVLHLYLTATDTENGYVVYREIKNEIELSTRKSAIYPSIETGKPSFMVDENEVLVEDICLV